MWTAIRCSAIFALAILALAATAHAVSTLAAADLAPPSAVHIPASAHEAIGLVAGGLIALFWIRLHD